MNWRLVLQRLGEAGAVLLLLSMLVYFLGTLIPGDAAVVAAGTEGATPEQMAALRAELRLDDSFPVRYANWLQSALTGDLGTSPLTGRAVVDEVARTYPVTLELAVLGLLIAVIIGVPAGVVAAVRFERLSDKAIRWTMLVIFSIPSFVTAILFVLFGSQFFGRAYTSYYVSITQSLTGNLRALFLPAVAVGLPLAAMIAQMTRGSLLESLQRDYVRFAMAMGLRNNRIHFLHALKPALAPVITLGGLLFGSLLGGLIVIEVIFNLPGLGRLIFEAVSQRDFPLVVGGTLTIAVTYVLVNLAVDMLYPVVDPRQRE